jgi:phosphoribosyl 1,2-cyclic phosphodiesterase
MKLNVVNSNSSGNSYALDTGEEILLIEAGCKMADVKKAIDYRLADVVGCIVTHCHGDHAKYATEYAKFGVQVYGPEDIAKKKDFPFGKFTSLTESITKKIGTFSVTPFVNHHDVPIFGYLIYHKDLGVMLFSTDSYKIDMALTGINHFLIEANYSDDIIKENFKNGKLDKHQIDRIMLSHMSLDYCIKYLRDCSADRTAKTITLCHLSERNSDPKIFHDAVAGAFAVPTFIAQKGLVVELNK